MPTAKARKGDSSSGRRMKSTGCSVPRTRESSIIEDSRVLGTEQPVDFILRPDEESPFLAFAVGILGAVEPAFRLRHFANDIIECFAGHAGVLWFAGRLKGFE